MTLSSLFSTVHGDAPDAQPKAEEQQHAKEEVQAEPVEEQEVEQSAEKQGEEGEEEEEPEDVHPHIREECQETAACAPLTKHFQHCQERVHAGQGYKHEDCVEELCKCLIIVTLRIILIDLPFSTAIDSQLVHMMHCVDNCVAPKLFSKLH